MSSPKTSDVNNDCELSQPMGAVKISSDGEHSHQKLAIESSDTIEESTAVVVTTEAENVAFEIEMVATDVIGNEELVVSEEQVIENESESDVNLCANLNNVPKDTANNNCVPKHCAENGVISESELPKSVNTVVKCNDSSTHCTSADLESDNASSCFDRNCSLEQTTPSVSKDHNQITTTEDSKASGTGSSVPFSAAIACNVSPSSTSDSANNSSSVGLGIYKKKFGKFRILLDSNEQNHLSNHSNSLHSQESSNDGGVVSEDSCSFDSKSDKCSVEPFVPPTLLRQQSSNKGESNYIEKHSDDDDSKKTLKSGKKKISLKKKDIKSNTIKKGKIVDVLLDFVDDAANRRRSSRIKSLEERKEQERAEKAKNVSELCQQVKSDSEERDSNTLKPEKEKKSKSKKHKDKDKDEKEKSRKKKNRKKKSNSHIFEDDSSEDGNKRDQKIFLTNDNLEIKNSNSDCFTPPLPPSQLNAFKNSYSSSSWNMKNATSDSDESPKPEKVKSRWRRSSELESGHSSENSSFINVTGNRALESLNGSISMNAQNNSSSNVSKEMEPVPEFVQIDESVYLFERRKSKSKKEVRRMVCDCILTKEERSRGIVGCGEDCLNRMLMIECGSRCPLGDHCANKRFQKKQYAKVDPFKTDKKGWGLRTLQQLQPGAFIMEYVGEVLAPNEFKHRVAKYSKENRVHHYFMALKNDEIIDATYKGNLTRFVNHSCEPNIETQKWTVNGELRIGFFAKRYVEAGEEVTFDYQFQRYGEKAQRCHCESVNCRGYIGASNVPHIDIDGSRLTTKAKERFDEDVKNEEEFEDLALEEEIEKLTLSGGLRNRQQTLMLARLMVRAEDSVNRQKLLQVMKSTQEIAYLRLLLDYHGLQLLWSWMFELEDIWLKAEILEVLEILPIPNKTMLKDSKILDVVEKWSKHTYNCVEQHLHANATAQLTTTKNLLLEQTADVSTTIKPPDDVDEKNVVVTAENTETTSEKPESLIKSESDTFDDNVCKETNEKGEESETVLGNGTLCTQNESGPNAREAESKHQTSDAKNENWTSNTSSKTVVKSSPISEEVKGEQPKPVPNIALLTTKLLNSWKDLKEVFRIPRLERQKRHEDEKEADRRTKELEERRARGLPIVYEKNKRGIDDRDCTIAGILGLRKKVTKRPIDDRKLPQSNANSSPHSTIVSNELGAPTPPKVNKDAHRMQFEMELMRKQYEEAMKEYQKQMMQYSAMVQQQIIQPQPQPPPQPPMHYQGNFELPHPSPSQTPALLQVATPPAFYGYENSNVHQRYAPKSVNSSSAEFFTPLSDEFSQNCLQSNSVSERRKTSTLLSNNSSLIECTSDEHTLADDEKAVISVDYGVEYVPVQKSKNGTLFDSVYPAPGTYFVQDKRAYFVPQPFDHKGRTIEPLVFEDVSLPLPASTARSIISTAFPRNWKGCRDKCGNVYYYNKATRRTQWNLPEAEMEYSECSARTQPESVVISSADSTSTPKDELEVHKEVTPAEVNGEPENAPNAVNSVDCSGTPVDSLPGTQLFEADPRKRRYLSNAVANILSAAACNTGADSNVLFSVNNRNAFSTESKTERRIKEKFKAEMSEHIKHCLNPYRRIDCRVGRILNNDDFKYLARKLTHFVMVKELKHCKTIEELSCNDTVKHKAKDYVRKYMAKQGPVFKIDAIEDKDEKNMSPKDGVTSDFVLEQSIDDM